MMLFKEKNVVFNTMIFVNKLLQRSMYTFRIRATSINNLLVPPCLAVTCHGLLHLTSTFLYLNYYESFFHPVS